MSIHYGRSSRDVLIGDSIVVGSKCVVVRGRDPGRLLQHLYFRPRLATFAFALVSSIVEAAVASLEASGGYF